MLIEPINLKGNPVPGEIIAIRRENGLVIHRLTKIIRKDGTDYFIARGDSNAWPDDPVKASKIAGRIVRAEYGEKGTLADIRINTGPGYITNRLRVIGIILVKRFKGLIRTLQNRKG